MSVMDCSEAGGHSEHVESATCRWIIYFTWLALLGHTLSGNTRHRLNWSQTCTSKPGVISTLNGDESEKLRAWSFW